MIGVLLLAGGLTAPPFSLTDDVAPRRYRIELAIDPDRETFQGRSLIEVGLRKPLSVIWLNATDFSVAEASVEAGGRKQVANAVPMGGEFLGLELASPVGPGRAVLSLRYQARLPNKAVIGPFRLKFEDRWYVFTTFTAIGARSAFPCFDQPRFKTPWELSLRVPGNLAAFANSRAAGETAEPDGTKLIHFAPTRPIPSELVAFAVGPFDVLTGAPSGRRRIPVRVIVPRGHAAEGAEAARITPDALASLEAYTGIPYPYDKLDHIALPENPFGATENPGLITYRMRALLAPQPRSPRGLIVHELAHQWFGNLVTQAAWEDVWLSEGFATWLAQKITGTALSAGAARERIMTADAGPKTRPVRLAMNDRAAMKDVYSGFVYQKGAAVLRMLEAWLGEQRFRAGLRRYLERHRFGTATTADLAAALGAETGPVLHDFLDQAGVPSIRMEVSCDGRPRVVLEQTNPAGRWRVPVCWKAGACVVVEGRHEVELPACPAWLNPNAGAAGYYRTEWSAAQLAALPLGELSPAERLALVQDVAAGRVEAAAVLKKLAMDPVEEVARAARAVQQATPSTEPRP